MGDITDWMRLQLTPAQEQHRGAFEDELRRVTAPDSRKRARRLATTGALMTGAAWAGGAFAGSAAPAASAGFDEAGFTMAYGAGGSEVAATAAPSLWAQAKDFATGVSTALGLSGVFKGQAGQLSDMRSVSSPAISPTFAFAPEASSVTPQDAASAKANQQLLLLALIAGAVILFAFFFKKG